MNIRFSFLLEIMGITVDGIPHFVSCYFLKYTTSLTEVTHFHSLSCKIEKIMFIPS